MEIKYYQEGFYITKDISNNSFSFDLRSKDPLGKTEIFVPRCVHGFIDDVAISNNIAIQEYNENNELITGYGIKNFINTLVYAKETVIVDNHNHSFYFWYQALYNKTIKKGCTLIHIDQHSDLRSPAVFLDTLSLNHIFEYTNTYLNVGNYIIPAIKTSLIQKVVQIRTETKLFEQELLCYKNTILNIDIDFFYDSSNLERKKDVIIKLAKNASFITIALSPFFIDQKTAINILNFLFG